MAWVQKNLYTSYKLRANLMMPDPELKVKMRPIGNTEPAYLLKEMWLNERCSDMIEHIIEGNPYATKHDVDFVFDADSESISMYRRRGIFVFDCRQDT